MKENGKIDNPYKLLKKLPYILTDQTYKQIEHAKKSTCLFNGGFCHPAYMPSLILR